MQSAFRFCLINGVAYTTDREVWPANRQTIKSASIDTLSSLCTNWDNRFPGTRMMLGKIEWAENVSIPRDPDNFKNDQNFHYYCSTPLETAMIEHY